MTDERPCGRQALLALGSAALALPGYADAATPPQNIDVEYGFFAYSEDDQDPAVTTGTDFSRYDIISHQIDVTAPVGASWGARTEIGIESMSGASPWFILPDADGKPMQVMSGATIDEDRQDVLVALTRYGGEWDTTLSAGASDENDYFAVNGGIEALYSPRGRQYSVGVGVGYSYDDISPTDAGEDERFPERIDSATRDNLTASASLSLIMNRNSVVQLGATLSHQTGFLSDPYKLVFVDEQTAPDSRPDSRTAGLLMLRWRRHLPGAQAALHLDLKLGADDWDIRTHTLEAAWFQSLGDGWSLTPGIRYYSQSQAEFYGPYFEDTPRFASSDYRLSPFGALSYRLTLEKNWQHLSGRLGIEQYSADGDYALGTVEVENPALVSYTVANLSVGWRFD